MLVTRGFKGKSRGGADDRRRLPPGQFLTPEFPVLTAGPTQHMPVDRWTLSLQHGGTLLGSWSWDQFLGYTSAKETNSTSFRTLHRELHATDSGI